MKINQCMTILVMVKERTWFKISLVIFKDWQEDNQTITSTRLIGQLTLILKSTTSPNSNLRVSCLTINNNLTPMQLVLAPNIR